MSMARHFILLFLSLTMASTQTKACDLPTPPLQTNHQQTDFSINQLYHIQDAKLKQDMAARIAYFSAQLLGKPYQLGALGEGSEGDFDQAPLYRTDAFDCETYVDTVLALAFAKNPATFKQCIRHIRYRKGQVSFITRNHFTCIDWNKNNQQQGFLRDITTTIEDSQHHKVAQFAQALINKPAWYQHFSLQNIRLQDASLTDQMHHLARLKQQGRQLPKTVSTIPYLPLSALFERSGQANEHLFKQIPHGAVIEIIRPNWDLTEKIGTRLNVSHLGLAIWKNNQLLFREASSVAGHVIDTSLIDYLRALQKNPTIKGINVQTALLQHPLSDDCEMIGNAE